MSIRQGGGGSRVALVLTLTLVTAGLFGGFYLDGRGSGTNRYPNHNTQAGSSPVPAPGGTGDTNAPTSSAPGASGSAPSTPSASAGPTSTEPSVEANLPSLAQAYASYFPIGAAIEPDQTQGLTAELLKKHVNWIVAENAMKPESLAPSEGLFTWDRADSIVRFAKENGMALRFHTLVWHNQTPAWFFLDASGNSMLDETDAAKREANKKLVLKRLDTYVRTVVSRYKDDIISWDVVNEVVEPADPEGLRNSTWYKLTGTDFIETAFRAARAAGGAGLKLYINDYSTDEPVKRDRLYELVRSMKEKGVPIDGVGHQTHINVTWPSVASIIDSMKKFADLGLDNLITELDMSVYDYNDRSNYGDAIPEAVLQQQAARYRELFGALRANAKLVSGVVFWGISDDHTWLSSFPVRRTEAPLLFDKQLHAKPAFWAIVESAKAGGQ